MHLLVLASGFAALSWEVVWQIQSALALGVSAWGTALTLAVTMGGMSAGALLSGAALRGSRLNPLYIYAALEVIIAACGAFVVPAFRWVENLDTAVFATNPEAAPAVFLAGIVCAILLPAACMGATLPAFGLIARRFDTSISTLYSLNTLGAAAGALAAAFLLIPYLGVVGCTWVMAGVNAIIGLLAVLLGRGGAAAPEAETAREEDGRRFALPLACAIVAVTGFSTFVLEVAWFRSLTSAFKSTTDAFAIMLSCVLLSLGYGASLAPRLRRNETNLGLLLAWCGVSVLLVTPLIERFDLVASSSFFMPLVILQRWFFMTLYVVGVPMLLLGTALPWVLDEQTTTRRWGALYGLNAVCAIIGSVAAGWLLLPTLGFAKTAWVAGVLVAGLGVFMLSGQKRGRMAALALGALVVAFVFESGAGRTRVQGWTFFGGPPPARVVKSFEGPDATTSVAEYETGQRALIINGFTASTQAAGRITSEHYMLWMGHLPMLLNENPKNALVICFGTGQTAHAVRSENPERLDIVDINPRVFDLAPYFDSNEKVLEDKRVRAIVMDGRAWLRRTEAKYDVISLEPMPPNFAGVNALYSREFYLVARDKMNDGGVIAQWVPFHILGAKYSASISKTFREVFPNAILWIDPVSQTGILLGSKEDDRALDKSWPGFKRLRLDRSLDEKAIREAVLLDREGLGRYAAYGETITDDNQILAYGEGVYQWHRFPYIEAENYVLLEEVIGGKPGAGKK